jgi:hypothetical protein
MVDTINPQTGQSDKFEPVKPSYNVQPTNSIFQGFGKPDDVHLNLASSEPAGANVASTENNPMPLETASPAPAAASTQFESVQAPSPAASPQHHTYSYNKDPLNWRLLLFVSGIGLIVILLAGGITYFLVNSVNANKLEKQQKDLEALSSEFEQLNTSSPMLELPKKVETPQTNTETPAPPRVEEQPIQTPEPTPSTNPEGMG